MAVSTILRIGDGMCFRIYLRTDLVEFIGAAGDVVLWHAFLCHTGSANVKDVPRFGIFGTLLP